MKRQLLLAMIFVFGVVFIPTYTIAALYDDFQKPNIDPNKWSSFELINQGQDGKLFSETIAYESANANNLNFKNPTPINHIAADVTVTEIEGDLGSTGINNYSSPGAYLTGTFYNDGSASGPGSWRGEVQASILIAPYNGSLWIYWAVRKITDDAGKSLSTLASGHSTDPVSLNTTYRLAVKFDPSSQMFIFKVDSTAIGAWTSTDQIHSPNILWKGIGTRVYFYGTGTGLFGRISATFDNVVAKDETGNVVVSDDFSSPTISPDIWNYVIREISDGKLLSKVVTNSNTRNSLEFKNPETVNEFQAKVTLLEFNNPNGALTRARLGGFFYNDTGDTNSGYVGDVLAEVLIGGEGTAPSVGWRVARFTNSGGTESTTLGSGTFPISTNLGETYDLFLGWDGSTFTFKCNDTAAEYTPTTTKFPPNNKLKDLATRVQPPDSDVPFEALVSATFDDVGSISSYFDTVQKTYIGYYRRPADPGGLIYWANRLDGSGGNLTEIIEAFADSAESQALYGTINSSNISTVVNSIYNALFGRDAEIEGLNWYVNGFNSGQYTPATIMLNVLYGAQNEDLQSVNNKLAAANLFTRTIDPELDGKDFQVTYAGYGDVIAARSFLSFVTSSSTTVPTQDQTTAYMRTNIADPGDPILNP